MSYDFLSKRTPFWLKHKLKEFCFVHLVTVVSDTLRLHSALALCLSTAEILGIYLVTATVAYLLWL